MELRKHLRVTASAGLKKSLRQTASASAVPDFITRGMEWHWNRGQGWHWNRGQEWHWNPQLRSMWILQLTHLTRSRKLCVGPFGTMDARNTQSILVLLGYFWIWIEAVLMVLNFRRERKGVHCTSQHVLREAVKESLPRTVHLAYQPPS